MSEAKVIVSAVADKSLREQVWEALGSEESYSITWVENSADLLINVLDKDVDLVIVHEKLGEIEGAKLVKIIKTSRPRVPLIVISTGGPTREFARILEEGIFYFLFSPIKEDELRQAVKSALKRSPTLS